MQDDSGEEEYPSPVYSWYVVGVLTLAYVFSFIDRQILSLLVGPIRRDLATSAERRQRPLQDRGFRPQDLLHRTLRADPEELPTKASPEITPADASGP